MGKTPSARALKADAGRQVHFDPHAESLAAAGGGSQPAVLFCTDSGVLGTCPAAAPGGGGGGSEDMGAQVDANFVDHSPTTRKYVRCMWKRAVCSWPCALCIRKRGR